MEKRRALVVLSALLALEACGTARGGAGQAPHAAADVRGPSAAGARQAAAGSPLAENVILVTIDGVRWQEVFQGVDPALGSRARLPKSARRAARDLVPNLYRLFVDGGAVLGAPGKGAGIAATGPNFVSLPAYIELMTGAASTCWTNDCHPLLASTLPEDLRERLDVASEAIAVFASWDRIARAAATEPGRIVLRAGRDPADEAPPWPGGGAYRPDLQTCALGIAHLVEHAPRFLWVALGDPDEWAHRGDYRGYLASLRAADDCVGEIVDHLAEMGRYGDRTAVLVTTDHGRDEAFRGHGGGASAAVWLMARGAGVVRRGLVATASERRLRDVAPTVFALLGQRPDVCDGCGVVLSELLPEAAFGAPVAIRDRR